jgi:SAM-dependent methyltransferase
MTASMDGDLATTVQLRRMIFGQLLSQAVCVAAELGLSDLLADGPLPVRELAAHTGAAPRKLWQLMRCLAAFGVYAAGPGGTFELTALGAALRSGARGSALPTALLAASEVGRAWSGLLGTVRTGRPAFDEMHGMGFFGFLDHDPQLRDLFDRSQTHDMELEIDQLLGAVDFSRFRRLVDVGGGDGALLARLLQANPQAEGILQDSAKVAQSARARMARLGLADRCTAVTGDFFLSVPPGGDLYLLRQILHDWDDERCVALLRVCGRAMRPGSHLMIIERVMHEGGAHDRAATDQDAQFAALMDLYMMVVLDGEERSGREFSDLLGKAGFVIDAMHRLPTSVAVIEATPAG